MLNLVFGRSGYGKTEYVFESIKKLADLGNNDILLITPEQYSLVTERRLLNDIGENNIRRVENLSFSRISDNVRREYGGTDAIELSKGAKTVLMLRAIDASKDELKLFSKHLDTLNFVNSMIKIYDEMKSCNLNSSEIISLSENIENKNLKLKLNDIALIMNCYEAQIANEYLDPADELTRLYNQIKNLNYFKDKYIFIDGFNGFVAQEYKILELIISEAKNVVITLCGDSADEDEYFSLFGYVNNSAKILKKIANKAGVEVEEHILNKNFRAKNNEITALEKNIFNNNFEKYNGNCSNVKIYSAKNITDECRQVAREVRNLLRNGYYANDIAIITRDIDLYRDELEVNFKKYQVPFFVDERQPITTQPLIVFIEYLLRCVTNSLRSEDILSLAKTGLTNLSLEAVNELENYVFIWNINGSKWLSPFTNSTKGFTSEISDSDKEKLDRINDTRDALITPILQFKNAVKGADCEKICAEIYYALINFNVDKRIIENAVELSKMNKPAIAEEQGRIWDLVMELLNQLPELFGNEKVTLKEFSKIFSMMIATEDLGAVPAGIDNVQFGQADRIRTDNPKAVFVLGASEGQFPQTVTGGGLLNENERKIMLDNDFKLYSYGEILNLQERYFAYMACTAPSEKLYVSYVGNTGKDSAPSEIITSIKSIFDIEEYSINNLANIDLIETYDNAFELMSENYLINDEFHSSLKEYFKSDDRFEAISNLAENKDIKIKDNSLTTSLFNYNMVVSASRVEDYYNCAFRYFCKFGLKARPLIKAEINPMQKGTLIHYVLEMILSDIGSKYLSKLEENEIILLVDKYIEQYFVNEMGVTDNLSMKFKYNFKRLSNLIYSVVTRLAYEFSVCDFEAKAFELKIDKDAQVKPEIINLDDGGTIQIRGSIDRVDTFEHNGERYVRVIDYKSGKKVFHLSDILCGLNLQMFIYLFSLCSDKNAKLTGIPAGVLYMHSSRDYLSFSSNREADERLADEEGKLFKMKGIVLNDENSVIPNAMENNLSGKIIPVSIKKDGDITGSIASIEELGYIHRKVNELVAQMGMELHLGNIKQNPVKNASHKNTCEYCDYKDVCAGRKTIDNRTVEELTDTQAKEVLINEYSE